MTQLLKKVAAMSTFRSKARVYTTSRDAVSIPYIKYTTDDIYTSGIRMNWLGELPASASDHRFTSTDVFDIKKIEVHNAYSSVPISEDMLMDSAFNITSVLTELFAESFALGEEEAFTAGNGVRRPRGLITETADITQVVSGNASALTADGILDLYFALPRQYRASAVWVMNSATQKAIEKFKDTQGRYLISSLLNSSLSLGETESLKGKPIMVNEFMPDIAANAFPLIFGDLSGYAIVDRMGISIQRLSEIYAEYNTVLFLCRKRVGGMLVEPWKFRVQKVAAS
jgi:HK97 family phage major capsid protein